MNTMKKTGTVKFYNVKKGFGFIKDNDDQSEIFVHATGLQDKIYQDNVVSYEIAQGQKGPTAINVKVIN